MKNLFTILLLIITSGLIHAQGTLEWVRSNFKDEGSQKHYLIKIDNEGNILVVGMQRAGETTIGGTTVPLNNHLIAKYDETAENVLWAQAINLGNTSGSNISAITVDNDNNIILAGIATADINLFGNDLLQNDKYLLILDSEGNFQNLIGIDSNSNFSVITQMTVDSENYLYISGYVTGFLGIDGNNLQSRNNTTDGFLAKITTDGTFQWGYTVGSADENFGEGIGAAEFNSTGNLIISGSTGGSNNDPAQFGDEEFVTSQDDIFLAEVNTTDGTFEWVKVFDGNSRDILGGLKVGPNDHIFLSGTIKFGSGNAVGANIDLGNDLILNANPSWLPNFSAPTAFLAKFDATGNAIDAFTVGKTGSSNGRFIAYWEDHLYFTLTYDSNFSFTTVDQTYEFENISSDFVIKVKTDDFSVLSGANIGLKGVYTAHESGIFMAGEIGEDDRYLHSQGLIETDNKDAFVAQLTQNPSITTLETPENLKVDSITVFNESASFTTYTAHLSWDYVSKTEVTAWQVRFTEDYASGQLNNAETIPATSNSFSFNFILVTPENPLTLAYSVKASLNNEQFSEDSPVFEFLAQDYISTTSIDEIAAKNNITIINSLVKDRLLLEIPENHSEVRYSVTDISGRQFNSGILISSSNSIDLSGLSNGLYLVTIFNGNQSKSFKILKTQ